MDRSATFSDLAHIRSLMERSTRFISLSGLSGVFAGLVALCGAYLAHGYVRSFTSPDADPIAYSPIRGDEDYRTLALTLVLLASAVLAVALIGAFWFTWRRSKQLGRTLWDTSARRLAWNLLIPLAAGGLVCLSFIYHGLPGLVAPATLVFYGLALLNASRYTLDEVRWLALSELALGVIASFWIRAGLLFWAFGFGVLHIVYGTLMWLRHERGKNTA